MKKLLLGMLTFAIANPAMAYITARYGNADKNPQTRAHILIVGKGNELGTLLQTTAATKAKKYADLYPNEQVYLITVNETGDEKNIELLRKYGFRDIEEKRSMNFDSSDVLSEMKKFKQIASVDMFSHSVAYYGVVLDGKFNRLDPKRDGYQVLAGNFTKDAYAFLHGCNSGQMLAPILSHQWGIPVAGSFTATNFARLHENGNWYFDDGRKPKTGSFVSVNDKSFQRNELCAEGACRRLVPDNFHYDGYWGSFEEGGLGFFKFFCMRNDTADCQKRMALAALSFISTKALTINSSKEDFEEVVFDTLCPISATTNIREECKAGLRKAAATGKTYDSFSGKSLQCDFKGCMAKFKCERIPLIDLLKEKSCKVINNRPSTKTTTQVEEYKAYMKGFELLQAK